MIELSTTGYYILGVLNLGVIWLAALGNLCALPFRVIERQSHHQSCWNPTIRTGALLVIFVAAVLSVASCWLAYRQEGGFLAVILAAVVLVAVRDFLAMRRVVRLIKERRGEE